MTDHERLERAINKFFAGMVPCPIDGILCNKAEPKECYRCGSRIGYSEGYDDAVCEMEADPEMYINEGND